MKTFNQNNLKNLYEVDEHLWLEETIKILKENRLDDLDLEYVQEKTGFSVEFPKKCPYTLEELLDKKCWSSNNLGC